LFLSLSNIQRQTRQHNKRGRADEEEGIGRLAHTTLEEAWPTKCSVSRYVKIAHNGGEDTHLDPTRMGHPDDWKGRAEGRMAIDLSLFNNSVTMLVGHLTNFYGEEATLETYVICARVKSPDLPGGSAINWIVRPGSEQLAGGLLREVVKAVEANGDGAGQQ
jgi:hypothetical protein